MSRNWWGSGFTDWALGYEDGNAHEEAPADPLMAVLVGKEDPLGRDRRAEADRGKACAGKSTLNRLELSSVTQDKYRQDAVDEARSKRFWWSSSFGCEAGNRRSWCWTWMRRMIRCTDDLAP